MQVRENAITAIIAPAVSTAETLNVIPATGASTRKIQLGTQASVVLPSACPITIMEREIGATSTPWRKPSRLSSTVEIVAKIAVKSRTSTMKPGYRYWK